MNQVLALQEDASTEASLLFVLQLLHHSFSQNLKYEGDHHIEPAQMNILMSLKHGPLSLSELARQVSVKPPTASRSVTLLVNAGLVAREVPENNRRTTLLSLTPAGKKKMAVIREKAEQHVGTILDSLNASDRKVLDAGLKVLIQALQH